MPSLLELDKYKGKFKPEEKEFLTFVEGFVQDVVARQIDQHLNDTNPNNTRIVNAVKQLMEPDFGTHRASIKEHVDDAILKRANEVVEKYLTTGRLVSLVDKVINDVIALQIQSLTGKRSETLTHYVEKRILELVRAKVGQSINIKIEPSEYRGFEAELQDI